MNAHSLPANVPLDELFGRLADPPDEPKSAPTTGAAGQTTKTASERSGVKPSYLSSAINWNQGVLYWGLND